jgi:hypothetical protein
VDAELSGGQFIFAEKWRSGEVEKWMLGRDGCDVWRRMGMCQAIANLPKTEMRVEIGPFVPKFV